MHPVAIRTAVSESQIEVLLADKIGFVGVKLFVIIIELLDVLVPVSFEQIAEKVPELVTVINTVVAPLFQLIVPVQPEAVKSADSPVSHKIILFVEIMGGFGAEVSMK
ncbi:hypothetical protein GCM10027035_48840 [Emticicia sediminis]